LPEPGLGFVLGSRSFDPEAGPAGQGQPVPGALRAAWTAGRPPGFSRGMNEHETHPAKKLDTVALRAKVRTRLDAKAQELAVRPPGPAPRYDELFFRGTTWLDSLSELYGRLERLLGRPGCQAPRRRRRVGRSLARAPRDSLRSPFPEQQERRFESLRRRGPHGPLRQKRSAGEWVARGGHHRSGAGPRSSSVRPL
jgi:hypothetical protein